MKKINLIFGLLLISLFTFSQDLVTFKHTNYTSTFSKSLKYPVEVEWWITKAKVHTLENVYSYMHIDSTVAFLREGLMLLNPSRIKSIDQLPEYFRNWDVIWAPEPTDIGYHSIYNNASPWINVNLLSINPNLVVLEEHQHDTRKELEKYGIDCAMLPMRHARTLGGCFHCVTLDIERG